MDWVVQVDCPEDADTYIHRAGRTARYEKAGRAVLFLDPSEEEGMLRRLEQKRVPIERIHVRDKKRQSVREQLQGMCLKDPALKYLGQKAFTSYVRSLHVQKDREVFRLGGYALEEFAASLGLPGAPRIRFLQADVEEGKRRKNAPRVEMALEGDEEDGDGEGGERRASGVRTKYDRMFERQNQDILAGHYQRMIQDDDDKDDINLSEANDDDLFDRVETTNPDEEDPINEPTANALQIPTPKPPKKKLKPHGNKLLFDDAGHAHPMYELEDEEDFLARGSAAEQRRRHLEEEEERVRVADGVDKVLAKSKRREKREKRKERERERGEAEGDVVVVEGEGGEDGLANFVVDAEAGGWSEEDEPKKKGKKWFQKEDVEEQPQEMDTFEDLEVEAVRLLG